MVGGNKEHCCIKQQKVVNWKFILGGGDDLTFQGSLVPRAPCQDVNIAKS